MESKTLPFIKAPVTTGAGARVVDEAALVHVLREVYERFADLHDARSAHLFDKAPDVIGEAAGIMLSRFEKGGVSIPGLSPETAIEAARNFFPLLKPEALRAMRESQLGTRPESTIIPPRITFHVLAGNVFVSGLESVVMGMLSGSCNLVRCSEEMVDPAGLWLEAVAGVDADFAHSLAVAWWPREWEACTTEACNAADAVIAYGNDESVAAVRSLVPVDRRFVSHGSKLSFAVIDCTESDQVDEDGRADAAAYDFTMFDQEGCLSPRAAFLVGASTETALSFGRSLCRAMLKMEKRFPISHSLEAAADLARTRDQALIEQALGAAVRVISRPEDSFVVTLSDAAGFRPGCTRRNCDLRVVDSFETLAEMLKPWRGRISTLGFCGRSQDDVRRLQQKLRGPRICAIGDMQKPAPGRCHDGRFDLLDLMQFGQWEV